MRRSIRLGGLLALCAWPVLATSINVVFYDNRFGVVDDVTGAYTQTGTLPVAASAGIASMNGLLYLEDFGSNLYSVDALTGATHFAGNAGLSMNIAVFGGGNNGLFALDYASTLYAINPSTGKASQVGRTGLAANYGTLDTSLSTDGTSLFYTAGISGSNDELYSINTATGLATDLGNTGVMNIAGSAWVNGKLELYQYGQSANYIYSASAGSIHFARGAQLSTQIIDGGTIVTTSPTPNQSSVPEPTTTFLVGLGLILVTAGNPIRRRR